jgi:MarR family transcriptional regulator, lower aerobic nicotinate degradation pathway regulator
MSSVTAGIAPAPADEAYRLDEQVGFALRRASQRHIAIFARHIGELTPPQFATLAMLAQTGPTSQNQLGTLVAMDAATVKGVIDRLKARGLVAVVRHEEDRRRLVVSLTDEGGELVDRLLPLARRITRETVAPLSPREVETLMRLLSKIG